MFKQGLFVAAFILAPTVALAQQADQELIQKLIPSLQTQRNTALDSLAVAEGRIVMLNDQLAKANARIKELEDKSKTEEKKK
jgi:hypothetical protein